MTTKRKYEFSATVRQQPQITLAVHMNPMPYSETVTYLQSNYERIVTSLNYIFLKTGNIGDNKDDSEAC